MMTDLKKNPVQGFLDFVYDFYSSMKAHEIKLVYEGKVTHQITKAFIALAEAQMEEDAGSFQGPANGLSCYGRMSSEYQPACR